MGTALPPKIRQTHSRALSLLRTLGMGTSVAQSSDNTASLTSLPSAIGKAWWDKRPQTDFSLPKVTTHSPVT